jgi:phospholipid transport system substrate-binding protein
MVRLDRAVNSRSPGIVHEETMLRRIAFVLAVSLAPFALPALVTDAQAQPAPGPGTKAIQDANGKITALLQKKVTPGSPEEKKVIEEIAKIAKQLIDVDQLGKDAMVNQWSKLTKPQQAEFLKVLRDLIDANYVKTLRGNVSYKVNYKGESPDAKGNLVVKTEVETTRKGRPFKIQIDYTLAKSGKDLKIVNVVQDGSDLVESYRGQFDKLIKDKGFDKLIENMKNKANDLNNASANPNPTGGAPAKS